MKLARSFILSMGEATDGILKFVPRFLQWLIRELIHVHGTATRLLFATDSPWSSFEAEYWTMESIDVPARVKEGIFWENARALYDPQ